MKESTKDQETSVEALVSALKSLPTESLKLLLDRAGIAPTTAGMTPEQLHTILATVGTTNAKAMQQALRKENPFYPEKSVYNPVGLFDDQGQQLPAKVKFMRPVVYVGVRLNEELLTSEEIELCNRFTSDKESREGTWTAVISGHGKAEKLTITIPCRTADERMGLPPFTHILRELLEGRDAVDPDALAKRVAALTARLAALEGQSAPTFASLEAKVLAS